MQTPLTNELAQHDSISADLAQQIAVRLGLTLQEVLGEARRLGKVPQASVPHSVGAKAKGEAPDVMPKITDYTVASAKTQVGLTAEVKGLIARGWQPYGGVSATAFGASPIGGNQYIQAMVKWR